MNIEQAKEILNEINPNGYCVGSGATDNDIDEAINIAIKSLDMWNKVIEELEDDEQLAFMYGSIDMYTGIKESREVIEKYKKEIEE